MSQRFYTLRHDTIPEWLRKEWAADGRIIDLKPSEYEVVSSTLHPTPPQIPDKTQLYNKIKNHPSETANYKNEDQFSCDTTGSPVSTDPDMGTS